MSIIESALKKAAKQGLVFNKNSAILSEQLESHDKGKDVDEKKQKSSDQTNLKSSELENVNGHQVTINLERLAVEGFIAANNPKSQLAEEIRVIHRPLVNNAHGAEGSVINRPNLVLICSGFPGEGEIFGSMKLALSTANER